MPARLVVLDDPARAERLDVDAVDLSRERQARRELEPALQLRRGAVVPERDLEAPRLERQLRRALVLDERIEVPPQRLVELARLHLGQIHPHAGDDFSRHCRIRRFASSTLSGPSFWTLSSAGTRVKKRWSAVCATEPRCIASGSASIVFGERKRSTNHAEEQSAKRSSSVTPKELREPSCSRMSGLVILRRALERTARAIEPAIPAVRMRDGTCLAGVAGGELGKPA